MHRINDQVYFIIDREIFRTDDGGETWTLIKTVNWDGTLCFAKEDIALGVAYDFMNRENALVKTYKGCKSNIFITPEVFTSKSVR